MVKNTRINRDSVQVIGIPPDRDIPQHVVPTADTASTEVAVPLRTGAERMEEYLPLLYKKRVALVVNQTSRVGDVHLVDTLLRCGVEIVCIFAPEHGFREMADAGEAIPNRLDPLTGIPLISLYGDKKGPDQSDLEKVDVVIFDIQDVGVRFYTYISTMHYVMKACARFDKMLLILDRPNPNGHYIDGPVRQPGFASFVGMHAIPVVHGLTVAELARMINGEGWLGDGKVCPLLIIPCTGYRHNMPYRLSVKPSPNLGDMRAIYLYPSLCFFEGTVVSVGRGTDKPFQQYGHPALKTFNAVFMPQSGPGAKYPPWEGTLCYGYDLSVLGLDSLFSQKRINLEYLIASYRQLESKDTFFLKNLFLDKLAGTDQLRKQIEAGWTAAEIRASWQPDLLRYQALRSRYLLYSDP